MYTNSRPKKILKLKPKKTARQESSSDDEADSHSEDDNSRPKLNQAFYSRNHGNYIEQIESLRPDKGTVEKLYPVKETPLQDADQQAILDWQKEIQERKEKLKSEPLYQFAILVAGNLSLNNADSLIELPTEWPAPARREESKKKAAGMLQNVFASGFLDFTPSFIAGIENSYTDVKRFFKSSEENDMKGSRYVPFSGPSYDRLGNFVGMKRLRDREMPTIQDLMIKGGDLTNQFARLVALNIKADRTSSSHQYQLNATYGRVMTERDRLLKSIVRMLRE